MKHELLEERRKAIVHERRAEGKGFAGTDALKKIAPGSRPRVHSVCPKRRRAVLDWYFTIYFTYKAASEAYRGGKSNTKFPPGTYKPYVLAH